MHFARSNVEVAVSERNHTAESLLDSPELKEHLELVQMPVYNGVTSGA
jgi:hypothetical protein